MLFFLWDLLLKKIILLPSICQALKNNNGEVILDVFKSEKGYPMETSNAILRKKISITNNSAVFSINLPQGEYAFALIHDENLNNKLDKNFLGIPKEGAAASNNAEGLMSAPSYEKAKFTLDKAIVTNIKILYF